MKLFRSREHPDHWIGEDAHGNLMTWPAEPGGWTKRTAWTGGKRQLEEASASEARGSGWPGGGAGRKPRSSEPSNRRITLRATDAEADAWERRAGEESKGVTVWARDELNAAAARPRSKK